MDWFLYDRDQVCNFIKKETLAQVFFCEFCKIPKNTFFTEHFRATASIDGKLHSCAALLVVKTRKWPTWNNKYKMKEIKINLSLKPNGNKKNLPYQRISGINPVLSNAPFLSPENIRKLNFYYFLIRARTCAYSG